MYYRIKGTDDKPVPLYVNGYKLQSSVY